MKSSRTNNELTLEIVAIYIGELNKTVQFVEKKVDKYANLCHVCGRQCCFIPREYLPNNEE